MVGLYSPRGNVAGAFLDNVRPYVIARTTPNASDISDEEPQEEREETPHDYPRLSKRLSTLTQFIDAVLH